MSLIQEALRRQQEESGEVQPEEITPRPSERLSDVPSASGTAAVPPPLPPPPMEVPAPLPVEVAPPAESGSRPWRALLGVLVVTVVLIGAGIWAVVFAFQQWKSSRRPPEGKPAQTVVAEPEPIVPAKPESTVEPLGPAVKSVGTPAPSPADLPPSRGLERSGLEDESAKPESAEEAGAKRKEEQVVSVPAALVVTQPESVRDLPASEPEPVKMKVPVTWPSITLTGLVGKGSNGSAILNNAIIGVGETIEGVKVVSIGRQGVVLEYEGETQFLKVGNSTK